MDSNRTAKRRSFSKSKPIKSLHRTAKPSASNSSATPYEFGGANQPTARAAPSPAVGFIIVNQEQAFPQPAQVALVVAEKNRGWMENFYSCAAADEGVDAKAAKYISTVQERFRLEGVNSERKNNYQDILV